MFAIEKLVEAVDVPATNASRFAFASQLSLQPCDPQSVVWFEIVTVPEA